MMIQIHRILLLEEKDAPNKSTIRIYLTPGKKKSENETGKDD